MSGTGPGCTAAVDAGTEDASSCSCAGGTSMPLAAVSYASSTPKATGLLICWPLAVAVLGLQAEKHRRKNA